MLPLVVLSIFILYKICSFCCCCLAGGEGGVDLLITSGRSHTGYVFPIYQWRGEKKKKGGVGGGAGLSSVLLYVHRDH